MFARMLRPSRRHAHDHERISQQEDTDNSNNDNADNSTSTSGNRAEEVNNDAEAGVNEGETSQLTNVGGNVDGSDNNDPSPESHENEGRGSGNGVEENENRYSGANETAEAEEDAVGVARPSRIQAERELRYRRQSTCTLLILFFLIRLWIEAIIKKDVGMIFLSLTLSTWTYRWFMARRDTEAELDRQIAENGNRENAANTGGDARTGLGTGADLAVAFDPDLGLLSFQAQMALAILESQRQMLENGGYGNTSNDEGPGVTKEAKEKWKTYTWGSEETQQLAGNMIQSSSLATIKQSTSNDYGSLSSDESLEKSSSLNNLEEGGVKSRQVPKEEPTCSICLCEYEHGEKVLCLPCGHIFHEPCLSSWTDSHIRCPLCNVNLMEGFEQPLAVQRAQQHTEEQRAFRTMALSTLGRRIRTSRRANRSRRAMRAVEDSIV